MKMLTGLLVATSLLFASDAMARDDRLMFSLGDALKAPAAVERIGKDVRLYFGKQRHPKVAKKLVTVTSNKKTNGFNKSDQAACEWAFLSAMLALQDRARREGGNAVVNIHSYYKQQLVSSRTEYMCGVGTFVVGVTFRGDIVRLKKGARAALQ